jgi:hypothetical protein
VVPTAAIHPSRTYRRVFVAIDRDSDLDLIDRAEVTARAHQAILEIVCGRPFLWPTAYLSVQALALLKQSLDEWQAQAIRRALSVVGSDISVRRRCVDICAARAVTRIADDVDDLKIVSARRSRWRAAFS